MSIKGKNSEARRKWEKALREVIAEARRTGNAITYTDAQEIFSAQEIQIEPEGLLKAARKFHINFIDEESDEKIEEVAATVSTRDPLRLYLNEISVHPLLTQEEEEYYTCTIWECNKILRGMLNRWNLRGVRRQLAADAMEDYKTHGNLRQLRYTLARSIGFTERQMNIFNGVARRVRSKPRPAASSFGWSRVTAWPGAVVPDLGNAGARRRARRPSSPVSSHVAMGNAAGKAFAVPRGVRRHFSRFTVTGSGASQPVRSCSVTVGAGSRCGGRPVKKKLAPFQELAIVRRRYQNARRRLILSNLRLVVSISKHFSRNSIPMLDLINEGTLGLMRSVDKFDPRKGFRFSTYATWWIRQAITRALADKSRTIRVPVHLSDIICRRNRVRAEIRQQLGREPNADELAKHLGLTVERLEEIEKYATEPSSLDMPLGQENTTQLSDMVENIESFDPFNEFYRIMLSEELGKIISSLQEKERKVIEYRYGLNGSKGLTLEETGMHMELTRERVRQIEVRALRKIRAHRKSKELLAFLQK